jgi:hypothetical protein
MKVVKDDENNYWFALLPYKDPNSMRVIRYDHRDGYVYYTVRYKETERRQDGITLPQGLYSCRRVQEDDGIRFRMLNAENVK